MSTESEGVSCAPLARFREYSNGMRVDIPMAASMFSVSSSIPQPRPPRNFSGLPAALSLEACPARDGDQEGVRS